MHLSREKFDKLVMKIAAQVVSSLPDDLREKAVKVVILTADRPGPSQFDFEDDRDGDLLGLYEGTPLTDRSLNDTLSMPDRITLFRLPLLDICYDMDDLREEIRITIIHEFGHFFGFEEDHLEKLGL